MIYMKNHYLLRRGVAKQKLIIEKKGTTMSLEKKVRRGGGSVSKKSKH